MIVDAASYLSDGINMEKFQLCLEFCNNIFISAPTGAGKTTFLIEKFLAKVVQEGKKILYLVPRTILLAQIQEDIRVTETQFPELAEIINKNLDVVTYHSVGNLYQMGCSKIYDYIICDEAHTILTESTYATESYQEAYDFLTNQIDAKKIYVSATIEAFRKFVMFDQQLKEVQIDDSTHLASFA